MSKDISPLTHEQWSKLEALADKVNEVMVELQATLLIEAAQINDDVDPAKVALLQQADHVSRARATIAGGYQYHPQSQWTGGDSLDPKNTKWREPHIVPGMCSATRYVIHVQEA